MASRCTYLQGDCIHWTLEKETVHDSNKREDDMEANIEKDEETLKKNTALHLPGPKGEAQNAKFENDAWNLFITEETLEKIGIHINKETERQKILYKSE